MRQLWQMWSEGFPSESIEHIEKVAAEKDRHDGIALNAGTQLHKHRRSKICWMSEQYWLRDQLYWYVMEANRAAFGIDVCNVAALQFTEYHGEKKGGYEWHRDVIYRTDKAFDRKISIVVQLSDSHEYEGGDFEFSECENPANFRQKGAVLVFPSYVTHRVTPVTKGVRKSLVAWFEGPKWR